MLKQTIPLILLGAVEYTAVVTAVMIDLWSGVRKSRRAGRACTSRGLRRTVAKLSSYLTAMLSLSVVDAICIVAIMVMNQTSETSYPVFPFFTTLAAVGLALIEAKSIFETAERKGDLRQAVDIVSDIISRV